MSEIAPMTKLTPNERLDQTQKLKDFIKGEDFEVGAPKKVVGYQLDNPEVKLSANNVIRAKDGSLMFKDKVKEAVEFRDYVIVYS